MAEYEYTSHPYLRKPNGKAQSCTRHRVVWMENYGEIPPGMVVHHKNFNKKDNRLENLQLVTYSEHSKIHHKIRKLSK